LKDVVWGGRAELEKTSEKIGGRGKLSLVREKNFPTSEKEWIIKQLGKTLRGRKKGRTQRRKNKGWKREYPTPQLLPDIYP